MENQELAVCYAGHLNGIRVERGDILRETATRKTVKVINVMENRQGSKFLQVEYNSPSDNGSGFTKEIEAFSFLS
jgi:hypothetical protein